jgi:hypothetical protein
LGKIGLFIYKYSYLRTLPRTLITVTIIVFVAVLITEIIHAMVRSGLLKRGFAIFILVILVLLSVAVLVKTGVDFSKWSYAHTGQRFKYGAYLLPVILILVSCHQLITLPRKIETGLPKDTKQTF